MHTVIPHCQLGLTLGLLLRTSTAHPMDSLNASATLGEFQRPNKHRSTNDPAAELPQPVAMQNGKHNKGMNDADPSPTCLGRLAPKIPLPRLPLKLLPRRKRSKNTAAVEECSTLSTCSSLESYSTTHAAAAREVVSTPSQDADGCPQHNQRPLIWQAGDCSRSSSESNCIALVETTHAEESNAGNQHSKLPPPPPSISTQSSADSRHRFSMPSSSSPRVCMYITEVGCASIPDSLAFHSTLSTTPRASSLPNIDATLGDEYADDEVRSSSGRRASCTECPQAFDPQMGDLALLDSPLVQSLMLSTL